MNSSLLGGVGRVVGVSAAETRERLLRAAATVFAQRGYDGARVADIATAAGVSNGALYAHYSSKADLMVAALRRHGRQVLAEQFTADPTQSISTLLLDIAQQLPRHHDATAYLIVEALTAARRDPDVAHQIHDYLSEQSGWMTSLVGAGHTRGELDPTLSPNAIAHLCLLLGMGSRLITPDLHPVTDQEWTTLITRVIDAIRPPAP